MLGNKIIVKIDTINLLVKNYLSSQIIDYLLFLQEYDISLQYISRKSNYFIDALSWLKCLDNKKLYEQNN